MNQHESQQALRRLLANGPLTALPKRPADQELLLELAAARFEPGRIYRENEVNEALSRWLETFCAPFGVDHVTIRRLMVDARLLTRDKAGSIYRISPARSRRPDADPVAVLAQIKAERKARKNEHAA